ncbi:MAG: hypothetical protein ACTSRU_21280, partial [Candidatus Hodarchaeales archaeon]
MKNLSPVVNSEGVYSKLKNKFSYLSLSTRSIRRNKRRSISMIAGLILGISILSGILLYSTVLTSNVYNTVIEGSPYEIRIDYKEELTAVQEEDYLQQFQAVSRISDAQFLYGNARSESMNFGPADINNVPEIILSTEVLLEYSDDPQITEGRIFSNDYYNSEIGLRLREKLVTGSSVDIYS